MNKKKDSQLSKALGREVIHTSQFTKDCKKLRNQEKLLKKLDDVVEKILAGEPLPANCRPHPVKHSRLDGLCQSCHVTADLVLIYKLDKSSLQLIRVGSHSEIYAM